MKQPCGAYGGNGNYGGFGFGGRGADNYNFSSTTPGGFGGGGGATSWYTGAPGGFGGGGGAGKTYQEYGYYKPGYYGPGYYYNGYYYQGPYYQGPYIPGDIFQRSGKGGFGAGGGGSDGNFPGEVGGFGGGAGKFIGGGGAGLGGALFVRSGNLTLDKVAFSNNSATNGTGGVNGQGIGGAMFIIDQGAQEVQTTQGNTQGMPATLAIVSGTAGFSENIATNSNNDVYGGEVTNIAIITGTVNNDTINGTAGNDQINGLKGKDRINGLAGNDLINGGPGKDTINGGTGIDTMLGGAGNDIYTVDQPQDVIIESANEAEDGDTVNATATYTLPNNVENLNQTGTGAINGTGNDLDNSLTGNTGNNILDGKAGNDIMVGFEGNDIYIVEQAEDVIREIANGGTDTVRANITQTLANNVEKLVQTGTSAINGTGNAIDNSLTGNSGNNVLDGKAGKDTMAGGAGNDTYILDHPDDVVIEAANAGTDTVNSNIAQTLGNNVENLVQTGTANINGTGNALNNSLTGNSGNNILTGKAGNDVYTVGQTGDVVVEAVNEGTDTVNSNIAQTLADNVEKLVQTGTGNINGTGNTLNNSLTGNSGNNVLDGKAGNDIMAGGAGNDTYIVEQTADVVVEAANAGTDTVKSNIAQTLGNNVEKLVQTGTAAINGTGNTLDNSLTGNSGNNVLDGKTGKDTMAGGAGNDTYILDQPDDVVIEAVNKGTDTVKSNIAQTLANNVENLVQTGTGAINGTGNTLNNSLTGNSGNNILDGAAGNDIMAGGGGNDNLLGGDGNDQLTGSAGNDILTGGAGADWFIFNATTDRLDTITDFNASQGDRIRISASGFAGGLVPGALPSSQFVIGTAATNTSHRFIYNNGALFYDIDGLGGTAQVQIATLTGAPTLAAGNIVLF
ncbi:MAG: hypothetical protein DSM107014_16750 [Gomphosphaeria aponina SAG 52.96 = DSM 107014]|uniref:Calcium-binding protein n=1 Tax=Gomphosphaeria aponina SAG 52.96 = DSM 107014 TaxID=1521640 RepID=A0A941GX17_9CHRO|nr:hypothetical protein [Gomphosphaeria aponina SAG 52.96 = DSM 107014]